MKDIIKIIEEYWLGFVLAVISIICLNLIFGTVCMSKIFIGIPCPACGMTRASLLVILGRFKEAYEMHPLVYLLMFEVIFCIIIKKIVKNYSVFIKISVIICLVIFIIFYIYRMYIYFPHTEPLVYWRDNYLYKIGVIYERYKLHE